MNSCSICLGKTRKNRMNTPCGHTFHGRCMSRWTGEQRKNTCPMCRAPGMKFAVLRGVTDVAVRLKTATEDFVDLINPVSSARLPIRFVQLQVPTREHMLMLRAILRAVFLVPHDKLIQDAFMNVVVLKKTMERKAFEANIPIERVYVHLFRNNKVLDVVDILSDALLYTNPLLVSPDANNNIVKPDFKYLKKLITKLFYDASEITADFIKARKAWKQRS